jgi:hypothetical protein
MKSRRVFLAKLEKKDALLRMLFGGEVPGIVSGVLL